MRRAIILIVLTILLNLYSYSQLLCTNPNSEYGQILWKGYLTEYSGKILKAIEIYKNAILLNPLCLDGYNFLSSAYLKVGDFDQVIKLCRYSLKLQPKNISALHKLGYALYVQQNYDSAMICFNKALSLDNSNLVIQTNISLTYSEMEIHEKELKTISSVLHTIELNPQMKGLEVAYINKQAGIIYFKYDSTLTAINLLLKANSQIPHDGELNYYLGNCYDKIGNTKKAKKYFKKSYNNGFNLDAIFKVKYQIE